MNFGFLKNRKFWITSASVGAGALVLFGFPSFSNASRRKPNVQEWTWPKNPTDKMQYLLDIAALGFGGQGTVYIDSRQTLVDGKIVVEIASSSKTKVPLTIASGYTCSRLTNLIFGYWCNPGANFSLKPAYNFSYQVGASVFGEKRQLATSVGTVHGYKEYCTKIGQYTSYGQLEQDRAKLNHVNFFERHSGHVGCILNPSSSFPIRNPYTREPFKGLVRFAADGYGSKGVFSVSKTFIGEVPPSYDEKGNKFTVWKVENENSAMRMPYGPYAVNSTMPLIFEGQG